MLITGLWQCHALRVWEECRTDVCAFASTSAGWARSRGDAPPRGMRGRDGNSTWWHWSQQAALSTANQASCAQGSRKQIDLIPLIWHSKSKKDKRIQLGEEAFIFSSRGSTLSPLPTDSRGERHRNWCWAQRTGRKKNIKNTIFIFNLAPLIPLHSSLLYLPSLNMLIFCDQNLSDWVWIRSSSFILPLVNINFTSEKIVYNQNTTQCLYGSKTLYVIKVLRKNNRNTWNSMGMFFHLHMSIPLKIPFAEN